MIFQIWTATDKMFCHFGPFFALLPPSLPPLRQQLEKSRFWKTEKIPGDIIILHKCAKNHDPMLYCSLDEACNRFNCYFSFWTIFYPFASLIQPKKSKFRKNEKKTLEISSFYNNVTKIVIIWYTVSKIWCVTDVIIFHFRPFFTLLTS